MRLNVPWIYFGREILVAEVDCLIKMLENLLHSYSIWMGEDMNLSNLVVVYECICQQTTEWCPHSTEWCPHSTSQLKWFCFIHFIIILYNSLQYEQFFKICIRLEEINKNIIKAKQCFWMIFAIMAPQTTYLASQNMFHSINQTLS